MDIYVAITDAVVVLDDVHYPICSGVTTVRDGHPLLAGRESMFEPLKVTYDLPEADPDPSPAAVRAWAKDNGVDVPARGKLPAELVEQYKASLTAEPPAPLALPAPSVPAADAD